MARLIAAIYDDSQAAGEAVGELKEAGLTDSISVLAKDSAGEVTTAQPQEDVTEGTVAGATTGGVIGSIVGALATVTPVAVAGVGTFLIAGPLGILLGAATGALGGGLVGALIDAGIPEEQARMFEESIYAGQVLVTVEVSAENEADGRDLLDDYGATEMAIWEMEG